MQWETVRGQIKKLPREEGTDINLFVIAHHGGWAWATAHVSWKESIARGDQAIRFALDHMVEDLEKVSPR